MLWTWIISCGPKEKTLNLEKLKDITPRILFSINKLSSSVFLFISQNSIKNFGEGKQGSMVNSDLIYSLFQKEYTINYITLKKKNNIQY